MALLKINLLLPTIVILSYLAIATCQEDWAEYGELCNILPGTKRCKIHHYTVACLIENTDFLCPGCAKCRCNLGDDAVFDNSTMDEESHRCVGLVDSLCFTEKTALGLKTCVANADCIEDEAGSITGTCQCLSGFIQNATSRHCMDDPDTVEKATPRTTTTTLLPPLDLLPLPLPPILGTYNISYNEPCNANFLIGREVCNTYEGTVSCINKKCVCNMGTDAEWHEGWGLCVSKVDKLCFTEANALGRKVCVENADCVLATGSNDEDHTVGTCECLYGFNKDASDHCVDDPAIVDKSTVRPTTPRPTLPRQTGTNPTVPETTPTTPDDGNKGLASTIGVNMMFSVVLTSAVLLHSF